MFAINDPVIINDGILKNANGVIKKIGNKEYYIELSILGKRVSQWFVEKQIIKKDSNTLLDWVESNSDNMMRKDIQNNTVAHIMYMDNTEKYLAYVYKPKGNNDIPEYDMFENINSAKWWCDEKLVELGYIVK